jgi:ribosomal peptide maturation radical SAM protein 1
MPWMSPSLSSLALGTLRPILEARGIPVRTLYGSLLFPRTETPWGVLELQGGFLFTPLVYDGVDRDALVERMIDQRFEVASLWGVLGEAEALARARGLRRKEQREGILRDLDRAAECVERCAERAAGHEIVGFSLTFESQLLASLALARRLKARDPRVKIVLGGAACVGEQADGIVRSFDLVDAVCHGEGEEVIAPLFEALRAGRPLDDVPGISFRDDGGTVRRNAAPPLIEDLDRLPPPQYDDFLSQHAASSWHDKHPVLTFETSRGCWWGQKHLCTFCGLNAEGLGFRSKSPERAHDEILALYRDHPQAAMLQATDNILEMKYFQTLLPRLARAPREPGRPLRIFYEVKANLRPGEVALLAAAGITIVQPGIEAFDDDILRLMDKGASALGQVQFLKWAYQERVLPAYNLIVRNPGETAASYRRMLELLPFLTHLPPPGSLTPMLLMRFSPYFERPAEFGIVSRRPFAYYRHLHPDPGVALDEIAYQFEYEHPILHDAELAALQRELCLRIAAEWQKGWRPHRAFHTDDGDGAGVVIHDRRGPAEIVERLEGTAAELFRYLDAARPFDVIARRFAGKLEPGKLRTLLDDWHARRWVCRSAADVHLSVLPLERARPLTAEEVIASARRLRVVG